MLFRTRLTYGKRDVWSDLLAWTPPGTAKTRPASLYRRTTSRTLLPAYGTRSRTQSPIPHRNRVHWLLFHHRIGPQ
jgi:hypothetical protein